MFYHISSADCVLLPTRELALFLRNYGGSRYVQPIPVLLQHQKGDTRSSKRSEGSQQLHTLRTSKFWELTLPVD